MDVSSNGTVATGGDALNPNPNEPFEAGDIAWVMVSTALVLLMIPGVGFFYSGLVRRKSALSLIYTSMAAAALISFQWFFWGYSLAFSSTASRFIGNMDNIGFRNVLDLPAPESTGIAKIPELLYAIYEGMFAGITVALALGAVAERGRLLPCLVFAFIWSTIIYDPIACWTWNPRGWSSRLGGLDFAGGTPVHIASGSAALAYSLMLGKRRGHGTFELNFRPHNVSHIVIGTVFLWVGWFGFNGGSALSANMRAVVATVNTNIAASVGGLTWCLIDYRLERKWSAVGFCSGVVTGLVVITPGSGYVPPWSAVIFGIVGSTAANFATKIKLWLNIDDALDIFAIHGIGGLVGDLLTGIFAANYIARLDGSPPIPGGWINGHWVQIGFQLADGISGMAYSFGGTCLILFVLSYVPGIQLRATEEDEIMGMDDCEMGEFAYDYVELSRDVVNGIEEPSMVEMVDVRTMSSETDLTHHTRRDLK